jgi:hypothetical protein
MNTASATTWSVCSRAKPTTHTGFGIKKQKIPPNTIKKNKD